MHNDHQNDIFIQKKWVQHPFTSEKERKYQYIGSEVGNHFPLISMVKSQTSCHIDQRLFTQAS